VIVHDTTRAVVEHAKHLAINDEAIGQWAAAVRPTELDPPAHELLGQLSGTEQQLANLVLLIDALNFCFWSDDPIRFQWRGRTYERFNAMFVSLMLAAKYEPQWCDPRHWMSVPSKEIRQVLSGQGRLLMLEDRERIMRETAGVLLERFEGQFTIAIESVNRRAWPLAVLLMTNFDSFRDVSSYRNRPIYFMKRAQICALDLSIAWSTHDFGALTGIEELSAFADYRVPQALRHLGIIALNPDLAEAIDKGRELARESEEEIEIRAATIQAVERMKNALGRVGKSAAAWQIDWYLWLLSHGDGVVLNHHRTRTVYY
jgi:hypothetical protein